MAKPSCGRTRRAILATALALAPACSRAEDLRWDACRPAATPPAAPGATIGRASMLPDGTIILDQLRFEAPGGAIGHAPPLRYRPDHPQYAALLRHLDGLRPREVKLLPACNAE